MTTPEFRGFDNHLSSPVCGLLVWVHCAGDAGDAGVLVQDELQPGWATLPPSAGGCMGVACRTQQDA